MHIERPKGIWDISFASKLLNSNGDAELYWECRHGTWVIVWLGRSEILICITGVLRIEDTPAILDMFRANQTTEDLPVIAKGYTDDLSACEMIRSIQTGCHCMLGIIILSKGSEESCNGLLTCEARLHTFFRITQKYGK